MTAWRPAVAGISEVLHARYVDHAYPMHTHDAWALLIVDAGAITYDLDKSGNHHGAMLKVTERYTFMDANHIQYEATIEDPETFSQPWKISLPLYRRLDDNVQLLEFKCVEFSEELLYGDLVKKTE